MNIKSNILKYFFSSDQRLTFRFETFANFLRVSVSVLENLFSEKSLGFGKFGRKKVSVSVNLNSEKSLCFGFIDFGLGKKFRVRKIWSRKKVSILVLENLVSEGKKSK